MPLTNKNKRKAKSSSVKPITKQVEDPEQHIDMFDSDDVSFMVFYLYFKTSYTKPENI